MKRRRQKGNHLNGKRLYRLMIEADSEQMRRIRSLLEAEGVRLISERHAPLSVRAFLPLLTPICLALYLGAVAPDLLGAWYPLVMYIAYMGVVDVIP